MAEDQERAPSFSSGRRFGIGLNVVLSMAAALALVVMVNYLSVRHFARVHVSGQNPHQLSALTLQYLRSLTNQVKVTVFFDKHDALYSSVSSLLNEYQLACPRIAVEYVDYLRNPGAAQLVKERYKLTFPTVNNEIFFKNLVIFDCQGRVKTVIDRELADYDMSGPLSGTSRQVKRVNFKGELLFTSAILSVSDNRQYKAVFLEGHREHDPKNEDPQMGYSKVAEALRHMNIAVEPLLLTDQEVPTNSLLVIAGPQVRFEAAELDKIDRFLNQGGRLLLLLNNMGRSGLERLLANWGVLVGDDLVFEAQHPEKAAEAISTQPDLIVTNMLAPGHPILKPLLRSRLHLVLPRSVMRSSPARPDPDRARVDELLGSSQNGIAVRDIRNGIPYPNPLTDRRGAIPLMVAVEKGSVPGITADRGSTRMVIVGDAIFLGNGMIDSLANRDFLVLSVNWLFDRSQLMGGIGPRPVREFQLVMTPAQLMVVRWILLAGMPGSVLLFGILVWWRRRA